MMTFHRSFLRGVILIAACGLTMACSPSAESASDLKTEQVKIVSGEALRITLSVDLPMTEKELERGLMGRTSLPEDYGMLFIFNSNREVYFWMKDTLIPLDMVFMDQNGQILKIHEKAVPLNETPIPSDFQVRAVLELAGGAARRYGLNVGDRVLSPTLSRIVAEGEAPKNQK